MEVESSQNSPEETYNLLGELYRSRLLARLTGTILTASTIFLAYRLSIQADPQLMDAAFATGLAVEASVVLEKSRRLHNAIVENIDAARSMVGIKPDPHKLTHEGKQAHYDLWTAHNAPLE